MLVDIVDLCKVKFYISSNTCSCCVRVTAWATVMTQHVSADIYIYKDSVIHVAAMCM